MNIIFSREAWEDCLYWEHNSPGMLKKVCIRLKSLLETPRDNSDNWIHNHGDLGLCSIRITLEHRLLYMWLEGEKLEVIACRYHFTREK